MAQIYGIQCGMTKLQLTDLILRYLCQQKEQGKGVRHSVETLTEGLNKHNDGLSVTKAQVYAAAKHLLDHKLITGSSPFQNSIIILSITPEGEDLIDSEFNV